MSLFVTFEGPEGSGKTTQIQLLRQALGEKGISVVSTREPGGTPIGEQIRAILHDLNNTAMLPVTEAFLYSAGRAQHVGRVILPALERGDLVISDRYAESTLAYQGYGHGLDLETLREITLFATGGLWPDLVVYLDLDVEAGLQRKWHDRQDGRGEWNRMDQQDVSFHRRVREGYLAMARQEPQRWLIVDAQQEIDVIRRVICDRVEELWDTKHRTSRESEQTS
ncbi:MAG: dTMP kinase [Chloroflexi bacterium RBG_13_56_8]|nr:MAG: dTMP kinase [Chloroflexi bacterium RBG_13_56_8]